MKGNKGNNSWNYYNSIEGFVLYFYKDLVKSNPDLYAAMSDSDVLEWFNSGNKELKSFINGEWEYRKSITSQEQSRKSKIAHSCPETHAKMIEALDLQNSEKQSARGTKGGNANVESGWWTEYKMRGHLAAHAPAKCKHCGKVGTVLSMSRAHNENCKQTPEILMPIFNALPDEFMFGMVKPFMEDLGISETLQSTSQHERWFKKVRTQGTYQVYTKGENYYKYKDEYNQTSYNKVSMSVSDYVDSIKNASRETRKLQRNSNIVKLYNLLPINFYKDDAIRISESISIPKNTITYITKNSKLVSSKNEGLDGTARIIYTRKLKHIDSIESISFKKKKNRNDLRNAYSEKISELYLNFIVNGNVDINKMYDYLVENLSKNEVGPIGGKQKLTKQLYAMGLEVIFIDYKLDNKLKTILNAIDPIEFTMKELNRAFHNTGLKTKIDTLLDKGYCVRVYDGTPGSKFDIPVYKKIL